MTDQFPDSMGLTELIQQVKVSLSPLFDKDRLMEFYQTLHPDKVPSAVKRSLEALLKGEKENLLDQF